MFAGMIPQIEITKTPFWLTGLLYDNFLPFGFENNSLFSTRKLCLFAKMLYASSRRRVIAIPNF